MIFCGQTAYVLLDVGHGIFLGRELRCAFSTFVLFEYAAELAILLGSRCARIFHEVLNKVPLTLFVESQHHAITPAAMGYFSNGPLRPGRDRFRPSGSPVTYFSPVAPKTLPGPIQSSSAVSVAAPRTIPSYHQRPTWPKASPLRNWSACQASATSPPVAPRAIQHRGPRLLAPSFPLRHRGHSWGTPFATPAGHCRFRWVLFDVLICE
jgi:hypothetical protein